MKTTRREFLQTIGVGAAAAAIPAVVWKPAAAQDLHFKLYLNIFNNVQSRMIWTDLIGKNIAQLGVEVVTSFVPPSEVIARRANETGATFADGGYDMYSERIYYNTLQPLPEMLFSKAAMPPLGKNFYRIDDAELEAAMDTYSTSPDPEARAEAIKTFQHRFYDQEFVHMVYYPEDVIATNPALKGFNETTYNPVFFPRAENWTIEGASEPVTAAFASWQPPSTLVPMFSSGYHESNIYGPAYNSLMEYDTWQDKNLVPALAESVTRSDDGLVWTIKLREGVKWHSGEPFTAEDVKFTWDTILNPDVGSTQNSVVKAAFGSPDAYEVVSPTEIRVTLPSYTIMFEAAVLPTISILPKHALDQIKPEDWRSHVVSTWMGSFEVPTANGPYTAMGAVGTGPWVPAGFDPVRKAYKFTKNPDYWKETTGNVSEFYVVNIQGADAVLSALKAGEIDAHDPMYDIGTLVDTLEEDWATVHTFDSYKWQQTCLNMAHPVFGTGVDTPLGKSDPSRAAEAAMYVRKAISHAIPREQIIRNIVGGYGQPGTVPMPFTAAEYDKDYLKPIAYDMDLARQFMEKAGYTYA